jgi:hypothetical protein
MRNKRNFYISINSSVYHTIQSEEWVCGGVEIIIHFFPRETKRLLFDKCGQQIKQFINNPMGTRGSFPGVKATGS